MNTFYNEKETYHIYEDKDIEDILSDKLGRDFSDYLMSRIEEVDADIIYAENLAATDFRNMEFQNERWQNEMIDVAEQLRDIQNYVMTAKRLNRDEIVKKLYSTIKQISGQI